MIRFGEFRESLLSEENDPFITQQDLINLEKMLDNLYSKLGIDVEFTKHFLDRVNDIRNVTQIRLSELSNLFKKEFLKFGDVLADIKDGVEAVLFDVSSNINIPFVMKWNPHTKEMELVAKTVMRKKNFLTQNKRYTVR